MAAKKPTVYLDTTILSSYWYEGSDILALGRRITTREWWQAECRHFAVWVSSATEDELEAGHYPRQAEALAIVRQHVVPETKPGDALQMAIAAAHRMDYLLTWNYAHLANPIAQAQLETACRQAGWRAPLLVSPETIPKTALGQAIRRR